MSFPRYPSYRDSGVEWLGEVPGHWEVKRLKHISPFITVGIVVNPTTYVADDGLPFIYGGDIREEIIDWENSRRVSIESSEANSKTRLQTGDLLTVRVGAPGITAVVPAECEGGNCASVMLIRKGNFNSHWLCFAMNTRIVRFQVEIVQYGAAQEQFNISHAINFWTPTPTRDEQDEIAAFLGRETAKFDALVAEQQRLMELLKEKRQAVISHAVTRGLNPDAPMKPSGIEWLGDVPAHWDVAPLGMLSSMIQTGPFGSQLHSAEYIDNGIPVINPSNIRDGKLEPDWSCSISLENVARLAQHKLKAGDIVFGRRGEMGRCALVTEKEVGWICGTGSLNVRLIDRVSSEFISIYLKTEYVREWLKLQSVGSTMDNLNTHILGSVNVPVPPLTEQTSIAASLDSFTTQFDSLTAEAQRAIDLLQERRTALISAAVTGQIDVRGMTPSL